MKSTNRKAISRIAVTVVIVIIIAVAGFAGYYVLNSSTTSTTTTQQTTASNSSSMQQTQTTSTLSSSQQAMTTTAQLPNIVSIAESNSNFSTLVTAIQAAGLASTLSGPGPFTVFAPTNAAFSSLPPGVLSYLLSNKTALTQVLTYHVVSGKLLASDVISQSSLKTLQGESLPVTVSGSTVSIGIATITDANIQASNGVIHVINAVLIPGGIMNIVQTAQYYNFSTLVTAVKAANLTSALSGSTQLTVFAPTNAAFSALPAGTLSGLLANKTALTNVLTYHVVAGRVLAADVVKLTSVVTIEGQNLTISVTNGVVKVNSATVIQTDILCSNGVIHVINAVLVPPTM